MFSLRRAGKIEQRIDCGDRQPLRALGNFDDFVLGADLAFFKDAQVEPRSMMRHEQGRHPRFIHSHPDAVASHTRLRNFEKRSPDPIAIADADFIVSQTFDGKIFTELAEGEVGPL